jgi:aminopeptidase-like protein
MSILTRIKLLYPFAYSVVGDGNDAAVSVFQRELPFRVHEIASGAEFNGWRVPHAWTVEKAELRKDGQLIYDGRSSPLGVVTLSPSFSGRVGLDVLHRHLFYSDIEPDATVYHWGALYRPGQEDWGFCIPKVLYEGLTEGDYEVEIRTSTRPGTMKVLDFLLPGRSRKTVLLNAHNCHPYQANDDISGCAVGIEVLKRLMDVPDRRLSYRLVIAPELIGTTFWLRDLGHDAAYIEAALLLKAVGNDGPLRLQDSFTGNAGIDRAAHHIFRRRYGHYESGAFRTIYGNDETVFEAPGYEIPTISLTRMPFPAYHTSRDVPDTLSESKLEDAAEVAFQICLALDRDRRYEPRFTGLVSLSNPRYGLYKPAIAPGLDKDAYDPAAARWNLLMNCLPRYLTGRISILEMAEKHDLPCDEVFEYVEQWAAKGLAQEEMSSS